MNGFFDFDRFEEPIDAGFQKQEPFPFVNPMDLVHPEGWDLLRAELPPIECPPDEMRRVFIVVYNTTEVYCRVRDWLIGKQVQQF